MIKTELRKIFRNRRRSISMEEKIKLDDLLLIRFQNFSYTALQFLFSYFPKENDKEPNTLLFSRYLSHFVEGLKIAYPVIDASSGIMNAVFADEATEFIENDFGIAEPVGGKIEKADAFDMIFIPLLCFDKQGYRVGYGGGYYDKFLANCRKDAIKLGFSYFEAIDSIDDKNLFDVPLNYCITPQKIYEF